MIGKPPMGWNSWNTFGADVGETLLKETADALVETGLAEAGYEYVVLDDGWALPERVNGRLAPDPKKFPHGIKAVADYVHSKGLKFGIYSCAGTMTCLNLPSSLDREFLDAVTFAEWEVDYLKYDYCNKPVNRKGEELYRRMGLALANSGRRIVFSACNWGIDGSETWIKTTGADLWRSTFDIADNWMSVRKLIVGQLDRLPYHSPGCWNDVDMLVVGMNGKGNVALGGCSETEYRTHFAAWCMLASPLMIGCDVRNIAPDTLALLKNKALIDICRDEAGCQPYVLKRNPPPDDRPCTADSCIVLVRHLQNGDLAIGGFNLSDEFMRHSLTLDELSLPGYTGRTLELTDCATGAVTRPANETILFRLEPHASVVYRAKVVKA